MRRAHGIGHEDHDGHRVHEDKVVLFLVVFVIFVIFVPLPSAVSARAAAPGGTSQPLLTVTAAPRARPRRSAALDDGAASSR